MPDYKQGKIYCLRSHQTDNIYIGSTTRKLSERMAEHRYDYRNSVSTTKADELLKYEDCYIELIELFSCDTKEQLNQREGHHIRNSQCVNRVVAGRTGKQYREENKEVLNQRNKDYYERTKEHRKEKHKEYRERDETKERRQEKHDCECGGKYTTSQKTVHVKTKKHQSYLALNCDK